MQVTAIELLGYLNSLERLQTSELKDAEKRLVAEDIFNAFPQSQYCIHSLQTRVIVASKFEEYINGFKAKETQTEKPVKSGKRKVPAKKASK